MAHHAKFDLVCERLRALLSYGALSASVTSQAEALLKRLEAPVRIAFIGGPGARSADVINALLGHQVVPEAPGRPPLELRYAEAPQSHATLADGRVVAVAGPEDPKARAAVFLSLTRAEPALKGTCLLDVATDAAPGQVQMALKWAASRSDIVVWCSSDYDEAERAAWQSVEEHVTDHAFLCLWGGEAGPRAPVMRDATSGEFVDVIALDLAGGAAVAAPLAERLAQHVEVGRQADSDLAQMFLRSHEAALPTAQMPGDTPPPPARSQAPVGSEPHPADAAPAPQARPTGALADLCQQAANLVRERARMLLDAAHAGEALSGDEIMDHCRETVEHLTEMLDARTDLSGPDASALSDHLMEAEELLVLLGLEGKGRPELDGICLMVQLRREFDTRAAA